MRNVHIPGLCLTKDSIKPVFYRPQLVFLVLPILFRLRFIKYHVGETYTYTVTCAQKIRLLKVTVYICNIAICTVLFSHITLVIQSLLIFLRIYCYSCCFFFTATMVLMNKDGYIFYYTPIQWWR